MNAESQEAYSLLVQSQGYFLFKCSLVAPNLRMRHLLPLNRRSILDRLQVSYITLQLFRNSVVVSFRLSAERLRCSNHHNLRKHPSSPRNRSMLRNSIADDLS
jgi:hypothetical protein